MKTTSGRRLALTVALAAIIVLTIAIVAGCGGSGTTATTAPSGGASGAQVTIKSFAYDPATVTIKVGESVTWTNQDPTNHPVVADNGEFQSGDLNNGASFTFKFTTAGTFPYHCSVHPNMTGTVIVQ